MGKISMSDRVPQLTGTNVDFILLIMYGNVERIRRNTTGIIVGITTAISTVDGSNIAIHRIANNTSGYVSVQVRVTDAKNTANSFYRQLNDDFCASLLTYFKDNNDRRQRYHYLNDPGRATVLFKSTPSYQEARPKNTGATVIIIVCVIIGVIVLAIVGFYVWLRDNYQQILEKNEIRSAYFDVSQFVHNGSEWCDGGSYGNVFAHSEDPTTRLKGKRLLIFELENIRSKPQLLSIVVHLIGITIRTLVWEQTGKRGFIIYEEFAELMQKPVIFGAVLYQMQAIRKKGGSACIVLQNLDQLALNAEDRYKKDGGAAGALMKNIETVIFLAGADPTGFEKYSTGFSEHDRQCVLSLRNNFNTPPMYSSFYIFRSKKSTLMSLCISPRTFLAFQTDGEVCDELGRLYSQTKSMERAIEQYERIHSLI